jgi:uncharacterized protein
MSQISLQAMPVKASSLMLREQDRAHLLALLAEYLPRVTAWAYGSRVNGDAHEASDLDLVLRSADLSPIPIDALVSFKDALVNSNIPILVEARDWARLPVAFHDEILKRHVDLSR